MVGGIHFKCPLGDFFKYNFISYPLQGKFLGAIFMVGFPCNCVFIRMRKISISKNYIICHLTKLYCLLPFEGFFTSCFVVCLV